VTHPSCCNCLSCEVERVRDEFKRQNLFQNRSADGAWTIPKPIKVSSCYEHMEYTREHFPSQNVSLNGKQCYFCYTVYEEDGRDVTL
jgi:hypothetical protein